MQWYGTPEHDLFTDFFHMRVVDPDLEFFLLHPEVMWELWEFLQRNTPSKILRNPPSSGFLGESHPMELYRSSLSPLPPSAHSVFSGIYLNSRENVSHWEMGNNKKSKCMPSVTRSMEQNCIAKKNRVISIHLLHLLPSLAFLTFTILCDYTQCINVKLAKLYCRSSPLKSSLACIFYSIIFFDPEREPYLLL